MRLDRTGLWYAKAALEVLGGGFEENGWNRKLTLEELKKVEERKMEDVHHVQEITAQYRWGFLDRISVTTQVC